VPTFIFLPALLRAAVFVADQDKSDIGHISTVVAKFFWCFVL